jgi:hypothetical protein
MAKKKRKPGQTSIRKRGGRPGRARSALAKVARGASAIRHHRRAKYMTEKTGDVLMSEATSLSAHFLGNEMDKRLPTLYGQKPSRIGAVLAFFAAVFVPKTWWRGKVKHLSRKVLDGFLHSILGEQLHTRGIEGGSGSDFVPGAGGGDSAI